MLVRDEYSIHTLTLTPHPNSIEEWVIIVNQDDSIRRTAANSLDDIKDRFFI